ncbi:MAG TPA: M14 family zinc carboxypeptidase [Actinomycetes bacterium]|nr:M14 family zinc carboxypeptidase [Actinomycetes bacterium]
MDQISRRDFLTTAGITGAAALGAAALPDLWTPDRADAAEAQAKPKPRKFIIGKSRKGRPIRAFLIGDRDAPHRYLVMGQMHGDEPAGPYVVLNRLLNAQPINNVALWLIPTMNPDGRHRGTRTNARGVDLNRNFPSRTWVKQGKGTRYWSGPRPASEPETRAIVRFFSRVEPHTVISLHQPLASVDFSGGDKEVTRWLSRHLNLPKSHIQISGGGTMTSWFNPKFKKKTAVTVELPPSTTPEYRKFVSDVLQRHAIHRRNRFLNP